MRAKGARPGRGVDRLGIDRLDVGALLDEIGDAQLVEVVEVESRLHVLLCDCARVQRFAAGEMAAAVVETRHARAALRRLAYAAIARPEETVAFLATTGQHLQHLLFGPAADRFGDGPLVVVPPARLHAVPSALLPALFGRTHEIAASARTWLQARHTAVPADGSVVLVRGPDLSTRADEVGVLAGLYRRPTVLRGVEATAVRVLDALDGSALAHIAAHGTFRADSPLFSAFQMADGPLTGYDFQRLGRAPSRLVLPCCDFARLVAVGGDDLLGLATALVPWA